jgi:hypothetical protein
VARHTEMAGGMGNLLTGSTSAAQCETDRQTGSTGAALCRGLMPETVG